MIQLLTIILILSACAAGAISYYVSHQAKQNAVTGRFKNLQLPSPTNEEIAIPPLTIKFGTATSEDSELTAQSVIPLNTKLNEFITTDLVKVSPPVAGTWKWENDNTVTFDPKKNWVAGKTYTFTFDKKFFRKDINLQSNDFVYTTPLLKPKIKEFVFYQNPKNVAEQYMIATVAFNYSIDRASFEKNVALRPQKLNKQGNSLPLTITYGKHDQEAYIRTANLKLPKIPTYYTLTINKEAHAKNSSADLSKDVSKKLLLPDASSLLKITDSSTEIIRNEKGKPEQILKIITTIGVDAKALSSALNIVQLPKDFPATKLSAAKENYAWQIAGEVTPDILKLATPVAVTPLPEEHEHMTFHGFKYQAERGRYLLVTVKNGMKGDGDYSLKNNYQTILVAPEYPHEIKFLHPGALLALGSEHKLSLQVSGLKTIKYQISRILPKEINHLITQTSGSFHDPYFSENNFISNISEIFTALEDFNINDPGKSQYTTIEFDKYLSGNANNPKPLGLFLIGAEGWDRTANTPISNTKTSRLVLLTDMALIVKQNQNETRDVFVASITQGKPAENVTVSVLGRNGFPLVTATTDTNGHVNLPALLTENYSNDKEPIAIIATQGDDVSFIPYSMRDRQINFSRFDTSGISDSADQDNLSAFVFSDRGIYRPGETAHLGFIVKKAFAFNAMTGLPLEIDITDPRGNSVFNKKINLPEQGFLTEDFNTKEEMPAGTYTARIYIIKDNTRQNFLGQTTLTVQDFLPDTMKISASFLGKDFAEGWVAPKDLRGKVKLSNLYGTPSADHVIKAKIILRPKFFAFDQYKEYTFLAPNLKTGLEKEFSEELPETKTNANGEADFSFNLDRFDNDSYEVSFYAEGFAKEGGRSVTTEVHTLVSPTPYVIGYKADGDLQFIKQNDKRQINLIAINNKLLKISPQKVNISLIKINKVSTLVESENGTYKYKTIMQEKVLQTTALNLTEAGINFPLPSHEIGQFALAITNGEGAHFSKVLFNVVGADKSAEKNTELGVTLDKKEYAPGSEVQLEIKAPYTGSGLITLERDKVYVYQWFNATSPNSIQQIKLPEDFVGNGYINVTFIRDWNSDEIFLNPLSYNVTPVYVDTAAHTIDVTLEVPSKAKAGMALPIQYKTDRPAQMILYAIDAGILSVSKYGTPQPVDFFFQKRALSVNTLQTIDEILPKFMTERELSSVGGDGSGDALGVYLNPFKRKNEPPVAFWSGIINSSENLQSYQIPLPESFNGTLRVMAVAVDANRVGSSETSTVVQNDFIILPNVPTFVAPKDEFNVSVNVTNSIKGSKELPITITAIVSEGLELLNNTPQKLTLNENADGIIYLKLRARENLGNASITLRAENTETGKRSELTSSLSIRPATPLTTHIVSGYSKTAKLPLPLSGPYYKEELLQQVATGSNPLIFVTGIRQYLNLYPYGCTEQITSIGFANLILRDVINSANPKENVEEKIKKTMAMLQQRQRSKGEFSYWSNTVEGDHYLNMQSNFSSVYAMHFLTEARELKYEVPVEMFNHGIDFLREYAGTNAENLEMARNQAYAIYVLTRNEIVTTNYLTNLQLYLEQAYPRKWQHDIVGSYIAATYALLQDQKTADNLIRAYAPEKQMESILPFYDWPAMNAQYIYLLAKHFPNLAREKAENLAITLANNLSETPISTIHGAFDLLALSTLENVLPKNNANSINILATTDAGKNISLSQVSDLTPTLLPADIRKVLLTNLKGSGFFYQLSQTGFLKTLPATAVAEGLEIYRDYTNASGEPVTSVKLGEEIIVTVKVRSLLGEKNSFRNIAIVDLLPGGFEMVSNSAKGDFTFQNPREDRMLFFKNLGMDGVATFNYRIKAIATGDFITPPPYAEDMYNQRVRALGLGGKIEILN